jgi:hypothetical protein
MFMQEQPTSPMEIIIADEDSVKFFVDKESLKELLERLSHTTI